MLEYRYNRINIYIYSFVVRYSLACSKCILNVEQENISNVFTTNQEEHFIYMYMYTICVVTLFALFRV